MHIRFLEGKNTVRATIKKITLRNRYIHGNNKTLMSDVYSFQQQVSPVTELML